MKIAFIVNKFPTISETFILNQITGLMDMGHQVEIFAQLPSTETKVQFDVAKYNLLNHTHYCAAIPKNKTLRRIKTLFLITMNLFRAPAKVTKALKILLFNSKEFSYPHLYSVFMFLGKKFDIIHAHFGPNGITGVLLKSAGFGSRLCVTFHGLGIRLAEEKGTHIYNKLFQMAEVVLANSKYTYDKLMTLGAKPDKTVNHPVGIDLERFTKGSVTNDRKPDSITIVSISRLVREKGLDYGIGAFSKLKQKYPDIHLIYKIIGEGPLDGELRKLIKSISLEEDILLFGPADQAEVTEHLRNANIFLLPSLTEGLGVVLLEAQAMELPIVACSVGGVPEAVISGKSAFLVPEKDVDALAEKLEYLITHPGLWSRMGIAGREYVKKNYDIKTLNQKLVKIYRSIL